MKKKILIAIFCISFSLNTNSNNSIPKFSICTAADAPFFDILINLIGGLHKENFDDISEIAVYNLGLTEQQISFLRTIKKVEVYEVEKLHPYILKPFKVNNHNHMVPGWRSWKPVIIKQTLEKHPHILYLDAGTTILKSLKPLFQHIYFFGYFFHNCSHQALNKTTTQILIEKFKLNTSERSWILSSHGLESGCMGISSALYERFILPHYELARDISYFEDDGSCPDGFGWARSQSIFSIFALLENLMIHDHHENSGQSFNLKIDHENTVLFHIANMKRNIIDETVIYGSRYDANCAYFQQFINFKKDQT